MFWRVVTAIWLTGTLLFAASDHIDLSAEFIALEPDTATIVATHNVHLTIQGVHITAPVIKLNYQTQQLHIPQPFDIVFNENRITAHSMTYDFIHQTGQIKQLSGQVSRMHFSSQVLNIYPRYARMQAVELTTCLDTDSPHYLIQADILHYDPIWGVLVTWGNTLRINRVPVLWFPTYIYGERRFRVAASQTLIPEVGQNNRDGLYIKESLAYFLNPFSSGTATVGWLFKPNAPYLGVTHEWVLMPDQWLNTSLHYSGRDGLGGGLKLQPGFVPRKCVDSRCRAVIGILC